MKLQDKVCIITGGAGGIGRATSILFAKEGAKVIVSDVEEEKGLETVSLIKDNGGEAHYIHANVSDAQQVENLVNETISHYGKLDILFNNAGVGNSELKLADLSVEEWDRVIDINLKGVFLGMKYAIPKMIENGGGVIVNTSSMLGFKGKKYVGPYNASKSGVILLTQNAALEYGRQNIRVNGIAPGVIDTAIIEGWKQDDRKWGIISQANALGRIGKPEEVAKAVLFLASEDASFVTATTLLVDGGTLAY
ncbi:SDR family NAD(P)-dependent oxidoreductase [Metabacillus herbersteinensis]|uniref:SDR family NAD(P)-dependent oxidoreductase n=1 Tax=Metabacillus herbersteinensis TaxID=283816 RepID=A0ABV6GAT2_9BACI